MNFDAKATHWDSDPKKVARANTMAAAIRQQIPLADTTRVLEYGCGTGLLGFALRPAVGEMVLADSSRGMLNVVEQKIAAGRYERVATLLLDLSADSLPDEHFDLICSLMTLHHVSDYQGMLTKFLLLLNSGGYLCLADLDAEDGSFHGAGFNGQQGFDRQELKGVLTRIGFVDINFSTVFEVVRGEGQAQKRYPVFLMICRRP